MAEEAIRLVLAHRQDHGLAIPSDTAPEIRTVTVATG
jgi:predicted RNase H-like HicB family nuclease